jgi:uncharacterized membrane protein
VRPGPLPQTVVARKPSLATAATEVLPADRDRGSLAPPQSMRAMTWSAPLPPPQMLAEYERAAPGTVERILDAFDHEGGHRRQTERDTVAQAGRIVDAQVFVAKFGAVSAAIVALAGFVVAGILASHGQYLPAAAMGGGEVVGLAILGLVRRPKMQQQQPQLGPPENRT